VPWPATPGPRRRPGPRTPPARRGNTPATRAATLPGPGPLPDQRLVGPGDHLDRLRLRGVPGDRAGAGGSRYGPCRPACARRPRRSWPPRPPAVPGSGPPATGSLRSPCTRRRPAPAPTGPDRSRSRPAPPPRHRRRHRSARRPSRAAGPSPPPPRAAGPWPTGVPRRPSPPHHGATRPSHPQRTAAQSSTPSTCSRSPVASGRTISDLITQCSHRHSHGGQRHPSSDQLSRADQRGHGLSTGLKVQGNEVLTRRLATNYRVCRKQTR
jgi:hypothetical protein